MTEDVFFKTQITKIFTDKVTVIDIGGGLRIDPEKNNRSRENEWLVPLKEKVSYKVLDKVADYHPDIVGDIHNLPFPDNSVDALVCISVLEHVEEPQKAVREMHRVLKPGGYCYIYAPFLFYYHPEKGYYGDYYRFTVEGIKYMTRDFSSVEVRNAKGALATVMNLFPALSKKVSFFSWLDSLLGKADSNQTSGYHAFCVK